MPKKIPTAPLPMSPQQTPALVAPLPPDADRRRLLGYAGAGALAVTLSACGGGGSDASAAPAGPAAGPPPSSSTPPASSPPAATPPAASPPAATPPAPSPPASSPPASPPPPAAPPPASSPPASPPPPPPPPPAPAPPAVKRGIAYDLKDAADFNALSGGSVGWWYNWALQPDANVRSNPSIAGAMQHVPMVWTSKDVNVATVVAALKARPAVKDLLVVNEPNLTDQANLSPADAAVQWLKLEDIARQTGVRLIGPALNWGTMAGYKDPIDWMDAFLAAFRGANGRDPQIDALAFHWYDYGLAGQLDRLKKYGKPFWVTEMANWHNGDGSAQIDTPAKQMAEMADMVRICESRSDVLRYSWFIGRMSPDPHFTSLFGASGVLTDVGKQYKNLPKA